MNVYRSQQGSITVETLLLLPVFLAFIFGLIVLIQFSLVQLTINRTAHETVKQIAVHAYPAYLLYQQVNDSSYGQTTDQLIETIKSIRDKTISGESTILNYAQFIPDPVVELVRYEQQMRESGEQLMDQRIQKILCQAFKPVVLLYLHNSQVGKVNIDSTKLKVSQVHIPNFKQSKNHLFSISLEYSYKLNIPFINKTIVIKEQAAEQIWIGQQ